MIVREHQFPDPSGDTKCVHCGDPQRIAKERSCIGREVPRATPPSMFAGDITHFWVRRNEIKYEEDKAWQAAHQE